MTYFACFLWGIAASVVTDALNLRKWVGFALAIVGGCAIVLVSRGIK